LKIWWSYSGATVSHLFPLKNLDFPIEKAKRRWMIADGCRCVIAKFNAAKVSSVRQVGLAIYGRRVKGHAAIAGFTTS
jgi:hypothetical protein